MLQHSFFVLTLVTVSFLQAKSQLINNLYQPNANSRQLIENLQRDAETSDILALFEGDEPPIPQVVSSGGVQSPPSPSGNSPTIEEINRQISLQHQNPLAIAQISPADLMFGDGGGAAAAAAAPTEDNPAEEGAARTARVRTNSRSPPRRGRLPDGVGNKRRRPSRSGRRGRTNNEKVLEGHKLITRALWRIFDALMEKNENVALQERVNLMEAAIREVLQHSTKMEDNIDLIKDANDVQDDHINELSLAMHDVKMIAEKVDKLEYWKSYFEGAQNDDVSHLVSREATYSSCPPRFDTVYGECFLLVDQGKKSWHEARRECAKFGADLAAPRNFESLREFLQNTDYSPEYVWVGASRQGNGDWTWLQGNREESKPVDMSEKTWNEDLPAGLGNCMGLYEGAGYRAYDYSCDELDLFVCQYFL